MPVKTPKPVVDKLYDETRKALAVPAVQEKLENLGVYPMPMSQADFVTYFRNDVAATVKLAKDAGIPKTDF